MSTATAFLHLKPFPFCVADISGSVPAAASYVDDLTLAEVMEFAWNLETLTLTTTGAATSGGNTANGNISFTLEPIACAEMTQAQLNDASMWFSAVGSMTAFASWPSIKQPWERVCLAGQSVAGCLLDLNADKSGTNEAQAEIGFWVGTDPVNSGKYRLYYRLLISAADPALGTTEILWDNRSGLGGYDSFSSGTVTIGGISLSWYSYTTTGSTQGGAGSMSASSTLFTY